MGGMTPSRSYRQSPAAQARDHRPPRDDVPQDGRKLRELRERLGLSFEEAGKLIGCHAKHLQHLERQERGASDLLLRQIAKAYGVPTGKIRRPDTGVAA